MARAVWWMVSRRVSHFSVAVSPACDASYFSSKASANWSPRSGRDILLTSGVSGFLARWNFFGLQFDLAAYKGVVCVAVRAVVVVRSCVNTLDGSSPDQDQIQLVPVL